MSSPSKRREMDLMKLLILSLSLSLSQFIKVSIFLLMGSLPFLFLILGPLCLLFSVGWWVITRWRWLMMECKNFMCNFMDPMTVSSLSSLFLCFFALVLLMKLDALLLCVFAFYLVVFSFFLCGGDSYLTLVDLDLCSCRMVLIPFFCLLCWLLCVFCRFYK